MLFDSNVQRFEKIAGRFTSRARIEFHSCQLGATTLQGSVIIGAGLLYKLANYAGVPVLAAERIQQADPYWAWEGPILTYMPAAGYKTEPDEYEHTPRHDYE